MKKGSISKIRKRKCRSCREWYHPQSQTQTACSVECALAYVRAQNAKKAEQRHKARKRELTPISEFHKKAQAAFNAFIRARDEGLPCVSCGRMHQGQWHAGHYRPVGGAGRALRYNEVNCHRQCSACNNHLSGNLPDYRENLIQRIGLPLVEWLEQEHEPCNWTRDELEALARYYRSAVRVLHQYQKSLQYSKPSDY